MTNRSEGLSIVEAEHRQHAVVEQTIRDLKDQALAHFPLRPLLSRRGLDRHRRVGTQPVTVDSDHRVTEQHRPDRPRPSAPVVHNPRTIDQNSAGLDAAEPARWPWAADSLAALTRMRVLLPPP